MFDVLERRAPLRGLCCGLDQAGGWPTEADAQTGCRTEEDRTPADKGVGAGLACFNHSNLFDVSPLSPGYGEKNSWIPDGLRIADYRRQDNYVLAAGDSFRLVVNGDVFEGTVRYS